MKRTLRITSVLMAIIFIVSLCAVFAAKDTEETDSWEVLRITQSQYEKYTKKKLNVISEYAGIVILEATEKNISSIKRSDSIGDGFANLIGRSDKRDEESGVMLIITDITGTEKGTRIIIAGEKLSDIEKYLTILKNTLEDKVSALTDEAGKQLQITAENVLETVTTYANEVGNALAEKADELTEQFNNAKDNISDYINENAEDWKEWLNGLFSSN